jgi:O-antigen/teichoic acid export membrane protein
MAAKARGGLAWAAASVVLTLALQLGFGAVMARLLDPATFGLVAMAMVALRLFSYLSQIGLSMTLGAVQRQAMTEDDLRLSLGVVWAASTLSIAATWLLAPLAAGFFDKPELLLLLRVLAFSLLLQALAHVSTSLLRRQLRFRALAGLEVLAYSLGYGCLGVAAALAGWGAWSLVAATFGQAVLSLVLAYACTRHALLPRWGGAGAGHWRYGARHTVISFSEFLSANMDSALIGRLVGDTALGLYNRAHVLVYQPMERAAGIFTRVLFPVVAAIQHERAKVGSLFVLGIGVIGVLAGVVSLSLSAAANDVVALLLGPRWVDAVPVVQLLALAVPVIFMSNIAGVLCDAMDLLRFKLKLQLCGMTLVLALMLGLSPHGVLGIVTGLVLGECLRCVAYVYFLSPHLAYRRGDAVRVLAVVLLACTTAAVAVHGVMSFGHAQAWPLPMRLLLEAVAGAALLAMGLLGLVWVLRSMLAGEVARAQVPGWRRAETVLARVLP